MVDQAVNVLAQINGGNIKALGVSTLKRLPGTNDAFNDPVVTGDPILAASAAAAAHGVGTPGQLEMRCVFDATRTGTKAIMTDQNADPAAVAAQMQSDYDNDANCL